MAQNMKADNTSYRPGVEHLNSYALLPGVNMNCFMLWTNVVAHKKVNYIPTLCINLPTHDIVLLSCLCYSTLSQIECLKEKRILPLWSSGVKTKCVALV